MALHSDRAHARLSPSASHRWVNCPGSIALSEAVPPRVKNEAADEGTAAHMMAERCLVDGALVEPSDFLGEKIKVREGVEITVDEEMVEGVQLYVDYVLALSGQASEVMVEKRVDLAHIADDTFGTVDFLAWVKTPGGYDLHVVDLKYGRHEVIADENPQLAIYASGALRINPEWPVVNVRFAIVQPRNGGVKEWSTTPDEIQRMEETFRDAAWDVAIYDDRRVPGEWCRWCPGAGICPEFREVALRAAQIEFAEDGSVDKIPDVSTFTPEQLSKALEELKLVEAYVKQVKAHAISEAKDGRTPPGWKLVGTRPRRRWISADDTRFVLASVLGLEEDAFAPRKLISPAQVEKLIGRSKQSKAELAVLAEKHSANVTLAPDSDPRPPVQVDASLEFGDEE